MLDRWSITITNQKQTDDESSGSKDNLASVAEETEEGPHPRVSEKIPFNIINNYFSIGVVSEIFIYQKGRILLLKVLWKENERIRYKF